MNNDLKLGLSINLKRAIIRVHKNTLRILGNPEYIVLLWSKLYLDIL